MCSYDTFASTLKSLLPTLQASPKVHDAFSRLTITNSWAILQGSCQTLGFRGLSLPLLFWWFRLPLGSGLGKRFALSPNLNVPVLTLPSLNTWATHIYIDTMHNIDSLIRLIHNSEYTKIAVDWQSNKQFTAWLFWAVNVWTSIIVDSQCTHIHIDNVYFILRDQIFLTFPTTPM